MKGLLASSFCTFVCGKLLFYDYILATDKTLSDRLLSMCTILQ